MALKPDSEKPMLPLQAANRIQCADDPNCRFPGRVWFLGMHPKARVCVDHACSRYAKGERDEVPPR